MAETVITFLDVGQGDSTVASFPDGGGLLLDCASGAAPIVVDYLERVKISSLELVAVTHSDVDHAGGIMDVINSFEGPSQQITFFRDRLMPADQKSEQKYLIMLRQVAQLMRDGISYWEPVAGTEFQSGGVSLSFLHPTIEDHIDALSRRNRNDASVALKLEYAGFRVLLGADIQRRGWEWILDRDIDLKADVFKFPHHGGSYSGEPSLDKILDLVAPEVVIISVGSTNGYGHPALETLELLRSHRSEPRIICTQATNRCHAGVASLASQLRDLLPTDSRGGNSYRLNRSCPCAGNITVKISNDGVMVQPTPKEHDLVIDLFEKPQCRTTLQ